MRWWWGDNHISCVMVSVLALSAVDHVFKLWTGLTTDYKIDFCCFSTKHTALRSKSKDWLARNHDNVYEWSDISTHGLLFQWSSTLKIQLKCVGLKQSVYCGNWSQIEPAWQMYCGNWSQIEAAWQMYCGNWSQIEPAWQMYCGNWTSGFSFHSTFVKLVQSGFSFHSTFVKLVQSGFSFHSTFVKTNVLWKLIPNWTSLTNVLWKLNPD
jgi:hypothetical protein